jgi:hypothetical protein
MLKKIAIVTVAGLAFTLQASQSLATPFFACETGYQLGLNNSSTAVHCKAYINPKVKPISCPNVNFLGKQIGTFQYFKSGKDICRGTVTIAGVTQTTDHQPLNCPSGYTYRKNYQGNQDKCVKPGRWVYKAPTRQINSLP